DGSPDTGFGSGGLVHASIFGADDEAFAVAIARDQKIIVTGSAYSSGYEFAVARFNADGTPDQSFGTAGTVTTSIGGISDQASALALATDGRIVAAGSATGSTTRPDFAVARYFVCGFRDIDDSQFHADICSIAQAGITTGCGGGNYCPDASVTRAQMAVFLLKAEHGISYLPPDCQGVFADVPCTNPFSKWIEQLAAEGITAGCGNGNYCPDGPVTRAQMATFLLK